MKVERFAILAAFIFASTTALANGVVSSVVKAPITPDGDVAGAPTDLVIDLDTWLDPATNGRPLPAGCSVAVTLPDAFEWTGLPVRDVFTAGCAPGAPFACTTGVFLQGWPQVRVEALDQARESPKVLGEESSGGFQQVSEESDLQ